MSFVDHKKDDITKAVETATEKIIHRRHAIVGARMDRITEKLNKAKGVVARSYQALESEADKLIAREETIGARIGEAFKPHHAQLDHRHRELDQLEDALKIVSNTDPLDGSEGESETEEHGE